MKTNLTFGEIKFSRNPIKRTTECIIECIIQKQKGPKVLIPYYIEEKFFPVSVEVNPTDIRFYVSGIATCHKDDEFNIAHGRRIAESRAKRAAFNIAKNYWVKAAKYYYNLFSYCDSVHHVCTGAAIAEKRHCNNLVHDNNN